MWVVVVIVVVVVGGVVSLLLLQEGGDVYVFRVCICVLCALVTPSLPTYRTHNVQMPYLAGLGDEATFRAT